MPGEREAAERFARAVADSMTRLRGFTPGSVPAAVRDDVFATMARHEARYVTGFARGENPDAVAQQLQDAEWDG